MQQAQRSRLYAEEMKAMRAGDYDGVIDACGKLLAIDPHDATALCERAKAWLHKNELDKCVADATSALRENPHLEAACRIRASALIGRDNAKALHDLDEAIQLDPRDNYACVDRAFLRAMMWDFDGAGADAESAIGIDPDYAPAYLAKGMALTFQGRLDDAVRNLDKAMSLSQSMGEAGAAQVYAERASAFNIEGEYDRGFADAESAIALDAHNLHALYERAFAHAGRKEYDGAAADFSALIAANPREVAGYIGLAKVYAETHENEKALAALDKTTPLMKGYGRAYRGRGDARRILKDYTGAAADFSQALRLQPADNTCLNSYAWLLATCPDASQRDGKRALAMAQKACEVSQWQTPANVETLAAAYAETGDFANAAKFQEWRLTLPGMTGEGVKKGSERLADYQAGKAWRDE